jgi:type IV pilus assembly protein PilA
MSSRRGFSLVEVMMVVAILGVIAALATVGMSGYLRHAKTAEATRALGNIEIGSRTQFSKSTYPSGTGEGPAVHMFCPTGEMVPPTIPKAEKKKVDSALWMTPTWKCLMFSISDPQYYAYKYTSNDEVGVAARYSATANGDLDGDGTPSLFELKGRGSVTGEAERESLSITNEDE